MKPKRKHLTGDCETDCVDGCAYPGQFSECSLGAKTSKDVQGPVMWRNAGNMSPPQKTPPINVPVPMIEGFPDGHSVRGLSDEFPDGPPRPQ